MDDRKKEDRKEEEDAFVSLFLSIFAPFLFVFSDAKIRLSLAVGGGAGRSGDGFAKEKRQARDRSMLSE